MATDPFRLLADLQNIISVSRDRITSLQLVADTIRRSGNYRWVGLYDVDHDAAVVTNAVWSGPEAPAHSRFPIDQGLTGATVADKCTINVGDVTVDERYLTALDTTRSEIIVPIFDQNRHKVIGTIDVESELQDAFGPQAQTLLQQCANVISVLWQI